MTTLKQQIRSIERTIARFKKESRGKRFASITSVELERKLANDPFIMMLRFDSSTVPGVKIEADLRVANYTISSRMCLHAWVGSGMVDPWGDTILLDVDTRFPRLTDCSGYIGERDIKLTLQIPTSVERTNYFLYFCLLAVGWDRKIFDRYIGEFQVR